MLCTETDSCAVQLLEGSSRPLRKGFAARDGYATNALQCFKRMWSASKQRRVRRMWTRKRNVPPATSSASVAQTLQPTKLGACNIAPAPRKRARGTPGAK